MKKQKRKTNQKGFTLIEMLITTALVAIFFSMAVSILPTIVQSYTRMITLSYARQIANQTIGAVEAQVMFADDVKELSTSPGTITGRNKNGTFVIPETGPGGATLIEGLVLDPKYYRGMTSKVTMSVTPGEYCTIKIVIYDQNNDKILERNRDIKLVGKSS